MMLATRVHDPILEFGLVRGQVTGIPLALYKAPFRLLPSPIPTPSITMPNSGSAYFIINTKSGTALDLSGDDQRSIIGFNAKRSDNQKVRYPATPRPLPIVDLIAILPQWRFIYHSDDDGWTIQNVYDGKYLDIPPVNPVDGTNVIAIDTPTPRRWDVFQDGDGWR